MDYSMVATAQIALLLYFWRERWLTCPIFFLLSFFLAFFFFKKNSPGAGGRWYFGHYTRVDIFYWDLCRCGHVT